MMNRSVQHGCVRDAMLDFEELIKLTEDSTKELVREQEVTKLREIHSRHDKRDTEWTTRFVQGPLRCRRWQRMNLDETYRTPSLFSWRH